MAKDLLNSDRINYLIWRYLLESDYRETAARLQKEWNLDRPDKLPFASHGESHLLVSILNKGLLYKAYEGQSAGTIRDVVGPLSGFFGPLATQHPPQPAADEDDLENGRKRHIDDDQPPNQNQNQNGSTGKRPRLSNGYENGFESTPRSPTKMDVDEEPNGDGNAYPFTPSPEQNPSPVVATNGPEVGTDAPKVADLASETTFLDLSSDSASQTAVLLQCQFNPGYPNILAAAGTDALARMWDLSRAPLASPNIDSYGNEMGTKLPFQSLLDEGSPHTTTVSCMSWSSDGNLIAVASEPMDDDAAKVDIWCADGTFLSTLPGLKASIFSLQWNPSNTNLLILSPIAIFEGVLATIWVPAKTRHFQHLLHGTNAMEQSFDSVWVGEEEFVICGGDMLQAFSCSDGSISPLRKYETRDGHALSKMTYDQHSRLLATASKTGVIEIWDHQGQFNSFTAHQGVISTLVWQPYQGSAAPSDDSERLIASAGEDGAISIWNARSQDAKSKSSMTMGSAVVALAFTPDGAFISGASLEGVLIWQVDDVHLPRASWRRGLQDGWQTPQSHDSAPEEPQHCLCWDAEGKKLAYGVNNSVAVINFRR